MRTDLIQKTAGIFLTVLTIKNLISEQYWASVDLRALILADVDVNNETSCPQQRLACSSSVMVAMPGKFARHGLETLYNGIASSNLAFRVGISLKQ